jgi:hypothetical protein
MEDDEELTPYELRKGIMILLALIGMPMAKVSESGSTTYYIGITFAIIAFLLSIWVSIEWLNILRRRWFP